VTYQRRDKVSFNGDEYDCVPWWGLFDPRKHGFEPQYIASNLGAGYSVNYAVEGDQLILSGVKMTLLLEQNPGPLLGAHPERTHWSTGSDWDYFTYKLKEPIQFSGNLIMGRELIPELSQYGEFAGQVPIPEICKYKTALMLVLKEGRVIDVLDLSKQTPAFRQCVIMTYQQCDKVSFKDQEYDCVDCTGLFDPYQHGFEPQYVSNSGPIFVTYKIEVDQLILSSLQVTLFPEQDPGQFFGSEPQRTRWSDGSDLRWDYFTYTLSEPIQFSGSLLLGREFIPKLKPYGQFFLRQYCMVLNVPMISRYKFAFMLIVDDGRIVEVVDLSEQMAAFRKLVFRPWWQCWQSMTDLYMRALAILDNALGQSHPGVATFLNTYATLLHRTKQATEAEEARLRCDALVTAGWKSKDRRFQCLPKAK
jgi:hypothetical protein